MVKNKYNNQGQIRYGVGVVVGVVVVGVVVRNIFRLGQILKHTIWIKIKWNYSDIFLPFRESSDKKCQQFK